jgi:transcription antitermination factor NusG
MENKWYALYTRSRAEKKVKDDLISRGIEVYLPLKKELRKWSDRKKMVEVPLINSYIFVFIDPAKRKDVFAVNGIVGFVGDMGRPAVISEREMDNMKRAVESKADFEIKQGVFNVGQMVRIVSGPMSGVEGQIIDIKGNKKIYVSVAPIGFTLVVNLNDESFEVVEKAD